MNYTSFSRLMESYNQVYTTTPESRFDELIGILVNQGLASSPVKAKIIAENLSDGFKQFLLSERPMYDVKTSSGTHRIDAKDSSQATRDARKMGHNVAFNPKLSKNQNR